MISMSSEKTGRRPAGQARPPDGEVFSEYKELAISDAWRLKVKEARRQAGINQGQLAAKLGTTQPTISDIETGSISSSKLVTPISEMLGVPVPYAPIEDDLERRWIEAGRLLRARRRDVFAQQLASLEQLIALLGAATDEADGSDRSEH